MIAASAFVDAGARRSGGTERLHGMDRVRETGLPSTASGRRPRPTLQHRPGVASDAFDARHTYAALDLGTNNCRLLIARPEHRPRRRNNDFLRIIDAFSRIVRLGEGLGRAGRISEAAIERTHRGAGNLPRENGRARRHPRAAGRDRRRAAARRTAMNSSSACASAPGCELEIIDRETEARFAARGCGSLADPPAESVLLFDIGGGSTELVWLTRERPRRKRRVRLPRLDVARTRRRDARRAFRRPRVVDAETFAAMAQQARETLAPFARRMALGARAVRASIFSARPARSRPWPASIWDLSATTAGASTACG